ncbi:uncharacterized protein LOC114576221 [Exaiptasia diaphana]|uniref:Uncharacterized protein n=1 Tax=Exaiptasia diaphana TaxID=2652724 RepID=A0A913YW40_EXADI|nr:uncharacterized protein LOC114576221 [Exaiptasia diaphana]
MSMSLYGEDDFLSRCVNLTCDGDSEWNFADETTDILSFEWDIVKLSVYSREPSREELRSIRDYGSRKSSLEKPVGHIMQLKPKSLVNENINATFWEKFLSKEISREPTCKMENTGETWKKSGREIQDNTNMNSASLLNRSKSADVISKCESSSQGKDASFSKQTSKNINHNCSQNRPNTKTKKHFSVYSKNFHLNSRFLCRSYYPMSYWKPSKSFPLARERTYSPSDSVIENKKYSFKRPLERASKQFRSWIWQPASENLVLKTKIINRKPKCGQSRHDKKENEKHSKFSKNIIKKEKGCGRSLVNRLEHEVCTSTISLPAISTHFSSADKRMPPNSFGQCHNLSCDSLLRQYQRQHDDLIKNNSRKKIGKKFTLNGAKKHD